MHKDLSCRIFDLIFPGLTVAVTVGKARSLLNLPIRQGEVGAMHESPEATAHAQGFVLSRIGIEMLNSQPLASMASKVWCEAFYMALKQ